MLSIIQSQSIEKLAETLCKVLKQAPLPVFQAEHVVVPTHGVGEWLNRYIADELGICAHIAHHFLGAFEWKLHEWVLGKQHIPTTAPFSASSMRWRIYAHLYALRSNAAHPDYAHYLMLWQQSPTQPPTAHWLWHISEAIASAFAEYVVYRADWLHAWQNNQPITAYLNPTADAEAVGVQHEAWQRHLWCTLFKDAYAQREQVRLRFWEKLSTHPHTTRLPARVFLFCPSLMPPQSLQFIARLAEYIPVYILHYNPSQEYWADAVDKKWLERYQLKYPERAKLYDSHHVLLTRFGKQIRDHFRLLTDLDVHTQHGEWVDRFAPPPAKTNLLSTLQSDMLYLEDSVYALSRDLWPQQHDAAQPPTSTQKNKQKDKQKNKKTNNRKGQAAPNMPQLALLLDRPPAPEDSLCMMDCGSVLRQVEHLHEQLLTWLHADPTRSPADIAVFSPDLEALIPFVAQVFPPAYIQHGNQPPTRHPLHIPYQYVGMPVPEVEQLWHAVLGLVGFAHATPAASIPQCDFAQWTHWLTNPVCLRLFDLNLQEALRIKELLRMAGFFRGFDARFWQAHATSATDTDQRFTLRFALDRLMLGLAVQQPVLVQHTLPVVPLRSEDMQLVHKVNHIAQVVYAVHQYLYAHAQTPDAEQQERSISGWTKGLSHIVQHYIQPICFDTPYHGALDSLLRLLNSMTIGEQATEAPAEQAPLGEETPCMTFALWLQVIGQQFRLDTTSSLPTQKVTFARLGNLRPVPFKLVVLMQMDAGRFPRYQLPSSLNLLNYAPSQLGDRSRLEDDLGAFLDALCLAQQGVWMYYTGHDPATGDVLLPASPVQFLLDYLREPVSPAHDADAQNTQNTHTEPSASELRLYTPYHHLVFKQVADHPLQSRTTTVCTALDSTDATASVTCSPTTYSATWQQLIAQRTQRGTQTPLTSVVQQQLTQLTAHYMAQPIAPTPCIPPVWLAEFGFSALPQALPYSMAAWAKQLSHPAEHFLHAHHIALHTVDDTVHQREPLIEDALSRSLQRNFIFDTVCTHALQHIIGTHAATAMTHEVMLETLQQTVMQHPLLHPDYAPLAPANVGALFLQQHMTHLGRWLQLALAFGLAPATLKEQRVCLTPHTPEQVMYVPLPDMAAYTKPCAWLSFRASKNKPKHRLQAWLSHLVWQYQRGSTHADVQHSYAAIAAWQQQADAAHAQHVGQSACSVVLFNDATVVFPAVEATVALSTLQRWLTLWQINQCVPCVVLTELLIKQLEQLLKQLQKENASHQEKHDEMDEGAGAKPQNDNTLHTLQRQSQHCADVLEGNDQIEHVIKTITDTFSQEKFTKQNQHLSDEAWQLIAQQLHTPLTNYIAPHSRWVHTLCVQMVVHTFVQRIEV